MAEMLQRMDNAKTPRKYYKTTYTKDDRRGDPRLDENMMQRIT
jgi:hypothetical protein